MGFKNHLFISYAHADNEAGTRCAVSAHAGARPILNGVEEQFDAGYGGTYDVVPLADGAEVLIFGRTQDQPAQPVPHLDAYCNDGWTNGLPLGHALP